MKHLKNYQLFEAFESNKLNKTLSFIKKDFRKSFLTSLSSIAEKIDFPISRFNDDIFEYLPFRAALRRNALKDADPVPTPCNKESKWLSGEFCSGGRVKRDWGGGFRMVECPSCGGSGFNKPAPTKPSLKLIKFWFDKDGKYLAITGCDGVIREQREKDLGLLHNFSRNIADYDVTNKRLMGSDIMKMTSGVILHINLSGRGNIIAMTYRCPSNDRMYVIQDEYNRNTPRSNEWKNFANYAYIIDNNNFYGEATLLESKEKKIDDAGIKADEAYTWNNTLEIRNLSIQNDSNMESKLRGAHFALVLNFENMKKIEYDKKSITKSTRVDKKSGSLYLKDPKDIKAENLNKYINQLVGKFDVEGGVSEVSKIIPRSLGWSNSIIFLIADINMGSLDTLISYLYMHIEGKESKESVSKAVKIVLKEMYDKSSMYNTIINGQIEKTIKEFENKIGSKTGASELDKKRYEVFKFFISLGDVLCEKLKSMNCETIADMEVTMNKIESIKKVYNRSRFPNLRRLRYMIDYMRNSSASIYGELKDINSGYYDDILRELGHFKQIIEKI